MPAFSVPPGGKSRAFNFSLALIEAMGNTGLTIVDLQPTPEMLEAGADAGKITPATACQVYSAMIGHRQ